jgi:hypothetical protein
MLLRDVGWFADADLDGVANELDCDPNSDLRPTVVIDGRNTEVVNTLLTSGCTISDRINAIARSAQNHGQFASGVAQLLDGLRIAGIITGSQKGAIQSGAALASIP